MAVREVPRLTPTTADQELASPALTLDLQRRDQLTAQRLREAMGAAGDLPGRLQLHGDKCLLVASSGGHIAQLSWLISRTDIHEDSLWMTFRTPQTEALLTGRRVHWLDYVPPRGFRELGPAARAIVGRLARERFDVAVSTGAGIALPALVTQAATGRRSVYVESISRVEGPSQTGSLLARVPRIERFTQHRGWESARWAWAGSVLDGLELSSRPAPEQVRNVLVTLGTIKPFRFDRLVDRLVEVLPADVSVTWQLGCTTRRDLPGEVHAELPATRMSELYATSDLVVSHAGVASALELGAGGVNTLLVPRRAAHGEHVDDHQTQIARLFAQAGLARVVDADALSTEHFAPPVPQQRPSVSVAARCA
jgi:UDP-N-acetylglucosamine--N-acetylmuramyl-(pentapeptide) pyrophosphoryl-undecaprenol N-acetylglucosamine transferase